MELEVTDFYLGGNGLEAYYIEDPRPAMAIDPDTEPARRRVWELVARGLNSGAAARHKAQRIKQNKRRHGLHGIFFFEALDTAKADPLAVEVLEQVLPEMEPDWILDVLDAKHLADNNRVAAAWCELPVEVVLAVERLDEALPDARYHKKRHRTSEQSMEDTEGMERMELPQESSTLEGFEAWNPDAGLPAGQGYHPKAFVSVRPGGNFGFNWNARKLMGNPEYVELLFDPVRRRVGFRPVPPDHPQRHELDGASHRGYGRLTALLFCRYYGILPPESRRYTPQLIDGVLVIDL